MFELSSAWVHPLQNDASYRKTSLPPNGDPTGLCCWEDLEIHETGFFRTLYVVDYVYCGAVDVGRGINARCSSFIQRRNSWGPFKTLEEAEAKRQALKSPN
jgi:hypothetical protein